MSLESFGEELRRLREQKQMSLAAISEATRISEKMLMAMEAGQFSVLPQTYIRAFLRAYARVLEANPDEILKRYDSVNQDIRVAAEERMNRSKTPESPPERITQGESPSSGRSLLKPAVFLIVIIVTIGAVAYLATRGTSAPDQDALSKVPFDKAVHETEAAVVQPEPSPPPVQAQPPVADSLRLEVTTMDTLWISVSIDNVRKGQYLFPPGRTHTWAAKEQFIVSMGNAGVATFRLNGNDIGALGKRGAVARNVVITQSGVQQAQ
jgi:transcriptional regulator with XRE-family HTH domain